MNHDVARRSVRSLAQEVVKEVLACANENLALKQHLKMWVKLLLLNFSINASQVAHIETVFVEKLQGSNALAILTVVSDSESHGTPSLPLSSFATRAITCSFTKFASFRTSSSLAAVLVPCAYP